MSDLTVETAKELVSKVREALNSIDYEGEVSYGFYFENGPQRMDVEVSFNKNTYLDKGDIYIDGVNTLTWDNSNTGN